MISSGGKNGRAPGPGKVVQAIQALLKKPPAPLADALSWQGNPPSDLVVAQPGGGEEDRLGSDDLKIL
jgi:hypothetical protein